MENEFFSKPILNSPHEYPSRHWELDNKGQPTHQIIGQRRRAEFITPVPKSKNRKGLGEQVQLFDFEEDDPISSADQRYDPPIINELRKNVDDWRKLPNPNDWLVTPETARLLQYWRHHPFNGVRPFFCQIEAVETAIWLTEVASKRGKTGSKFLNYLDAANQNANPELMRLALIAGLLCFGINLRRFLRQAGLRVMAFSGIGKKYQAQLDVLLDAPLVG